MCEGQVQIEEQKIDDVAMQEAIGQVAKNAGKKQPEGEPAPWVARFLAHEQHGDDDQRDAGERDEKRVVVAKGTEGCAGVRDMDQFEEIWNNDRAVRKDQ